MEKNVFYLLKSPYFQLVTKLGAFKRSKHPAEIDSHEQLLEVVEKWRKTAWSWSRTGGLQDEDYPRPRLGWPAAGRWSPLWWTPTLQCIGRGSQASWTGKWCSWRKDWRTQPFRGWVFFHSCLLFFCPSLLLWIKGADGNMYTFSWLC